jgi:hypothetical protein
MNVLVYEKEDKSIMVVHPVGGTDLSKIKDRVESTIPEIKSGKYVGIFDTKQLPQKRSFRDCWRFENNKININPELETAARWKDIREKRNKILDKSDSETMRANEIGSAEEQDKWKKYRQALRDITLQKDPRLIVWPEPPK